MTNYNVKKVKLIDRIFLEVEIDEIVKDAEESAVTNEIIKKCKQPVHADLIAAFDALVPHLPHLCELTTERNLSPVGDVSLSSYAVTGYTIGGQDEHEGVTIIGRKNLSTKKVLNLIAPFTKWEEEHVDPYRHAIELKHAIANLESEVLQYMFHGKIAPKVQLELDLAS